MVNRSNDKRSITKEEQMNVLTHGYGILLSILAVILLQYVAWKEADLWDIAGATVYGITLIMMFTISTIMHALPEGSRKQRFVMYDHMSIYVFIAGSYSPFLIVSMREQHGLLLLGAIWLIALAGICYKRYYTGRYMWLSTLGYLAMGWLVTLLWSDLSIALGDVGLYMLLAGGLCYTAGIVFFVWERLPYHHAVWHVFVLAGAALHYGCVFLVISG